MARRSGEHFGPRDGSRRDGGIFGPQDEKLEHFRMDQLLPGGAALASGADYLRQKAFGQPRLPGMGRLAMEMPLPPQTPAASPEQPHL